MGLSKKSNFLLDRAPQKSNRTFPVLGLQFAHLRVYQGKCAEKISFRLRDREPVQVESALFLRLCQKVLEGIPERREGFASHHLRALCLRKAIPNSNLSVRKSYGSGSQISPTFTVDCAAFAGCIFCSESWPIPSGRLGSLSPRPTFSPHSLRHSMFSISCLAYRVPISRFS